jgi:hypothetical protein
METNARIMIFCKKLDLSEDTVYQVSRLLYEEHIYKAVDDRLHDVWYAHKFLQDIESGKILVFGVFKDDVFAGCANGELNGDVLTVHALFKRKVDVAKAALLIEKEIKKYSISSGIEIKAIIGTIPEYNRAALRMAKRAGYTDCGIAENVEHRKHGRVIPCRLMRKEI